MTLRTDQLQRELADWTLHGLIDPDQRDAIVAFERSRDHDPGRRLSVTSEIVVYLGGVLTLAGASVALATTWDDASLLVRLLIAMAVATAGIGGGEYLFRTAGRAGRRAAGFVAMLGSAGFALGAGLLIDAADPRDGAWIPFVVGAATLGVGLGLWRNRPRPLQLATAAAGFALAAAAVGDLVGDHWWVSGALSLIAGAGLVLAAKRGLLAPITPAVLLGAGLAYAGALWLQDVGEQLGQGAALFVAVAFIAEGVRTDDLVLLVAAIAGAAVAAGLLLTGVFSGLTSAVIVTVAGLVMVGSAVAIRPDTREVH